ncbi:MAG: hypothetical protein ACKOA8_08520 [Deltaproteobacteria bacterium]
MKRFPFAYFVFVLSCSLLAHPNMKITPCGLPDQHNDDTMTTLKKYDLSEMGAEEIHNLPLLTQQQLIISAKEAVKEDRMASLPVTHTLSAVQVLRENSEMETVFVTDLLFKGRKFTFVEFYPGGNPSGYYFSFGTKKIIATNGDSTVTCLE